jgi:multicomponent Na+:H+ antiporter subunit E
MGVNAWWSSLWPSAAWLAGLWWLLTGGAAGSWLVGVPAVLGAAWVLRRPDAHVPRLRLLALPRFVPWFLWASLKGGLDVAARVLRPRLAITPQLVAYPLTLADERPRVAFVALVSLLPGTLSARLDGDTLHVHTLVPLAGLADELADLEARVAGLMGVSHAGGDR